MADFREMSDVSKWVEINNEALLHAMIAGGGFTATNAKMAAEWVKQKNEFMARKAKAERDAHQRELEEQQLDLNVRAVAAAERAAEAATAQAEAAAAQAASAGDAAKHARMAWIVAAIAAVISLVPLLLKLWSFIYGKP